MRAERVESGGTISALYRLGLLLLIAFGVLSRVASPTVSSVAAAAMVSQTLGSEGSAAWQPAPEWLEEWQILGSEVAQPDVSEPTDAADACVILWRAPYQWRSPQLLAILAPDAAVEARVTSPSTACTAPRGPPQASA